MSWDLKIDKDGNFVLAEPEEPRFDLFGSIIPHPPGWEERTERLLWEILQQECPDEAQHIDRIKIERQADGNRWQLTITLTTPPSPYDTVITL